MQALLLDNTAVDEVMKFYKTNAEDEVLYPRNPDWIKEHLGDDFFLTGILTGEGEELIAVAWMAKLKNFVYFTVENEKLFIRNDGSYAYSGGWYIRPDCRGMGMFKLLAATVNLFWFTKINKNESVPLWGRMVGQKDADGSPLFWNRVGERVTGLPYHELLALPFGTMEQVIFDSWPKDPIPLTCIPQDILRQTLGKTHESLTGPLNQFIRWGCIEVTDRFVPTSLNRFHVTTKNSISDPEKFFYQALSKVLNSISAA